eukprot:gene3827-4768_t
MSTIQMAEAPRGEKPPCCVGAARGHCTLHCPRIEDVLYSQRKGKTNKGAQRWRCKACGTKWTSKGIIQPPVVPDTIVNSIGYGSGPEEISIDMRTTRPYKKTRTVMGVDSLIPTSPFPSLFGNTSPSNSPIPSPPSPMGSTLLPSTVPSSRPSMTSSSQNIVNSYTPILPGGMVGAPNMGMRGVSSQQRTTLSSSASKINLTTKPVVVGLPSPTGGMAMQQPTPGNTKPISFSQVLPMVGNSSIASNNIITTVSNPNIGLGTMSSTSLMMSRPPMTSRSLQSKPSPPQAPPGTNSPLNNNNTGGNQIQPPLSPKSKLAQMNNLYLQQSSSALLPNGIPSSSPLTNNQSSLNGSIAVGSSSGKVTFIQSTPYKQPTPPQSTTSSSRSSPSPNPIPKVPSIYHNSMRVPSPDNQFAHHQHSSSNQQNHQQQTSNLMSQRISESVFSPFGPDSFLWGSYQSSTNHNWIQQNYIPSTNMLECLKKVSHSVIVFLNEFQVEHRLKLANFLSMLAMPSSEMPFHSSTSKKLHQIIDSNMFNISKHYQSLYQLMSKQNSVMEDIFVPLTEVFFDDNEINKIVLFIEQSRFIEENFEVILQEIQQIRDTLLSRREAIEASIVEPPNLMSFTSQQQSGGSTNLEIAKQETTRLLDSLAPLESTLTNMESKLVAVQKDIGFVQKIFSFVELIYTIHINYHHQIIEKHQKQIQNYIVDVIQQSLYNADVLSASYNRLKLNCNMLKRNGESNGYSGEDPSVIDTNNPYINKLQELLSKYDNSRLSPSVPKERKVLAVYHPLCLDHTVPEDHPESPKRLAAVIRAVNEFAKQSDRLTIKNDPEEVSDKWILTVHSPEYLRQLEELTEKLDSSEIRPLNVNDGAQSGIQFTPGSSNECEDGDTFISKMSLRSAKRAAGATLCAVDAVMKGSVTAAFVASRPPGHHSGREGLTSGTTSQGFCLLNNVCIAGKYAQLKYNVEKIAIIDFDVHHGNGTEEILNGDPGFLFLSIHMYEEGFYPGSGGGNSIGVVNPNEYPYSSHDGSDSGTDNSRNNSNNPNAPPSNIINIPMDPKSSANSFLKAFAIIIDKLNEYQPDLLLISCGFDAHIDDHLASLCLLEENYAEITRQLKRVADRWCKGRLISVLEGGYNISALKQCTIAHLMALTEDDY